MARGDTLDLQVLGGVAGQLEDLNRSDLVLAECINRGIGRFKSISFHIVNAQENGEKPLLEGNCATDKTPKRTDSKFPKKYKVKFSFVK